jgi:ferredoxin-fold anticodon binding domain-containing protein
MNCYKVLVKKIEYSYAYMTVVIDETADDEVVAAVVGSLDAVDLNFKIDDEQLEIEEIRDHKTTRIISLESMYV